MLQSAMRWRLRPADPQVVRSLARRNALPELVARLLACRGHVEPERAAEHLAASLNALHEPALLPGMAEATARLARAIQGRERILVHGDYDVDGVTGTVLLMRLFALLGARADWHIPSRLVDGYSFGRHSIERARACEASVVVSVDNGTSAGETIAELAAMGVDTVVTDHHEPPDGPLPAAAAIVNPKLAGSSYPFRELCGSGVAFKLAWGLCQEVSGARRVREDLRLYLHDAMAYVALATVCDVVPLIGENRVLARRGLAALETSSSAGLRALLEVAGLGAQPLCAEDVGFKLGPRLNAAGRLGSAALAVELLLARDPAEARRLALELDKLNVERRRIEAELCEQVFLQAERRAADPVLVLAGEGWHAGVVGIVAARVAQRFRRPALVIGLDGATGRGSARSIDGFDVLEAMRGGERHMLRFGGHAQAAGCEVRADEVDRLREAICERARALAPAVDDGERALWIDGELELARMGEDLMRAIDRLEPFGAQNEKPVLVSSDLRLAEAARVIGQDGSHLALVVRQGERALRGVAFGMGARAAELAMGAPLHVAYTPRWNHFRGERRLELLVHDFRVGERPALAG
ncbi:MAG TPA: single-stranded-DNA-specific exonuclease RecJ [Planctomycetota bacterium]|nr:single-stranded-DNA-specific exonuclease RecJ [Planctomycetota bacterium]